MSFFEFMPGCRSRKEVADVAAGLGVRDDGWFSEQDVVNAAFQTGGPSAARETLSALGARTEEIPDFSDGEGPWRRW